MAEAVSEEYRSSLMDLNSNSKPHINMLTMLAEENVKFAPLIVDAILTHIKTASPDLKLPTLYLVDSIMKNIGGLYVTLFSKHMISLFSSAFEKVEETTRRALYKLRQTWNDTLPKNILCGVDRTVNTIDPAWPMKAMVSTPLSSAAAVSKNLIHVNPKFLGGSNASSQPVTKRMDSVILKMKKQGGMLNQLDDLQFKVLEEKKNEVVAKPKKSSVLEAASVPFVPHQHIQVMNHRDPRIRKLMEIYQTCIDVKGADKPGATSLQSVVVPNTRLQSETILNSNGIVAATSAAKTKDGKSSVLTSNTFHAHEASSDVHKGVKNADKVCRDFSKDRHCKVNKKHSTSPENKLGANAKRFCKHPVWKSMRLHEGNLEFKESESPLSKNHRMPESILFSTVDKDCRHQLRSEDRLLPKWWPSSQHVNMHPQKARERPPPPLTTSIVLDGKNRTIHFVNDRALTFTDNEPKEVAFVGPPRNVYVDGMPHPLLLDFDGRSVEFLMEGKHNILRFGTPSREIYINNYPYEAKFGGPYITAFLEDQKEHKIIIDGPPPQVIISQKPAYELFELFKRNNILQNAKNIKKEPEGTTLLQDVDMRVKPSHVQSTIFPESKKDVDWRYIASASDSSHVPWNLPKNSFEIYNDVSCARNYTPGILNIPSSQLEYPNRSNPIAIKNNHFFPFPERNTNNKHAAWPHPRYRETIDQSSYEQLHYMDQKSKSMSPNTTFDQMQPLPSILPPPPSIPLSFNLSVQGSLSLTGPPLPFRMPNLSIPPPAWNPLPSPPVFTRPAPDSLRLASVGSNSNTVFEPAASLPALPIDVETIYERLVAAGIIPKKTEEPKSSPAEAAGNVKKKDEKLSRQKDIVIPDIQLTTESLRQFNPYVIDFLYSSDSDIQCETCGMRFKKNQGEQYNLHFNWHIRMKRREKRDAKKAFRLLYSTIQDWIQYKGTEEDEETTSGFCELLVDDESSENEEKIQSIPSSECESKAIELVPKENLKDSIKEEAGESIPQEKMEVVLEEGV